MVGGNSWPTPQIFEVYRVYALKNERPPKERIGIYTFQFAPDHNGVIIQRGVYSTVEKTWEIHQPSLGSKDDAVKHHWELLVLMSHNHFPEVEAELNRLAQQE
ncbi:hypothetical protein KSZ_03750 [Dictyobacter formicarum]|uniref:GIY-YIG nuclease family protein n=2 Tax=Dictyobacter formicarum TaxID=2778368 RepID=A0ABQ3V950_9CHLR|nr:hypothetical protein KSZ_03750 [Dictyobacter formicarum]